MHLYYRNINDAFVGIVKGFHTGVFANHNPFYRSQGDVPVVLYPPISRSPSRNGEVLTIEEPVTITYTNPLERVLFNQARDCNPFFHVVEALWMLAGRNDLEPLVHFNSEMAKFSDNGKTLHGAYGKRWRGWFANEFAPYGGNPDQLEFCIKVLTKNPDTRRVVLEMWDAEVDLPLLIRKPDCKDIPCNLCVMFRPRKELREISGKSPFFSGSYEQAKFDVRDVVMLDMTVINRSNDMLLGALGANYVHFSFLQEYVALACGYSVGHYHQISNNLHQYISPKEDGADWLPMKCQPEQLLQQAVKDSSMRYLPGYESAEHIVLYNNRENFDKEIKYFFDQRMWRTETIQDFGDTSVQWRSPFMLLVALPMVLAFNAHKRRDYEGANLHCKNIRAADWYTASTNWLDKRRVSYTRVQENGVHAAP